MTNLDCTCIDYRDAFCQFVNRRVTQGVATTKMDPFSQSFRVAGLLSRSVVTLFLIVAAVGTTLVCVFFFQEHTAQLSALAASDLRLDQAIYTEAIARLTKDMAVMQYQARLQSDLDADIAARQAKHAALDQGRQETTRLRLEGDQDIADRLAAEINGRQVNDTSTQYRIANASVVLDALEAFDVFTLQQFMIKMDNITDITSDILAEIATRTGIDMALMVQDTLIQNALSILVSELNTETSERFNRDMVIMNQLGLITGGLMRTINYQNPLNDDIQIVSLTPTSLEVDNGAQNSTIVIRAYGIQTVAGVGPNPMGNVDLVEGQGITIDYPAPNTVRISSTSGGSIPATNFIRISRVFPYGQASSLLGYTGAVDTLVHTIGNCNYGDFPMTGCPVGWDCIMGYASNPSGRCRGATSGCIAAACSSTPYWGSESIFFFCTGDGGGGPAGGACRKTYCTNHNDCADALGSTGWFCQNHRCTNGFSQGDAQPLFFSSYPNSAGVYRRVPNNAELVTNRPPSPSAIGTLGSGCYFPGGYTCGFYTDYTPGVWLVQFTITLRIQTTNLFHTNNHFFRMYIDFGAGWEQADTEYVGQASIAMGPAIKRRDSYVTMTTTRIVSTAQYGFGAIAYMGFVAYVPYTSDPLVELYISWYRFSYDVTRLR